MSRHPNTIAEALSKVEGMVKSGRLILSEERRSAVLDGSLTSAQAVEAQIGADIDAIASDLEAADDARNTIEWHEAQGER